MTDDMGSVYRARAWMYRGDNSLIRYLQGNKCELAGPSCMTTPVLRRVHPFPEPNACEIVADEISPDGWCRFYKARPGLISRAVLV
jgi:hypothetical protein